MRLARNKAVVGALALLIAVAMVATAAGAVTEGALFGAALVIGGLWALRAVTRKKDAVQVAPPAHGRTSPRRVELLPPPERYRHRSPTSQRALHEALLNARLGSVASRDRFLFVDGGREGTCGIALAKSEGVVLSDLEVETTSDEFALRVCDTLAVIVGPFTFRASGLELFVDGATPVVELQRQLHDLRMTGPVAAPRRRSRGYVQ